MRNIKNNALEDKELKRINLQQNNKEFNINKKIKLNLNINKSNNQWEFMTKYYVY